MSTNILRGIAIGLWILTGLGFLLPALLPGSTGTRIVGPVLLALAVAWTALVPRDASAQTQEKERGWRGSAISWTALGLPRRALAAWGLLVALAVALVIIRTGDRRSFLFAAFTTLVAAVLTWNTRAR